MACGDGTDLNRSPSQDRWWLQSNWVATPSPAAVDENEKEHYGGMGGLAAETVSLRRQEDGGRR